MDRLEMDEQEAPRVVEAITTDVCRPLDIPGASLAIFWSELKYILIYISYKINFNFSDYEVFEFSLNSKYRFVN